MSGGTGPTGSSGGIGGATGSGIGASLAAQAPGEIGITASFNASTSALPRESVPGFFGRRDDRTLRMVVGRV